MNAKYIILAILFLTRCLEATFEPPEDDVRRFGRHFGASFSWETGETGERGAHLHLYYLSEFEHHYRKCVEDRGLSGSHTPPHTHSLKCKLLCRRVATYFNDSTRRVLLSLEKHRLIKGRPKKINNSHFG